MTVPRLPLAIILGAVLLAAAPAGALNKQGMAVAPDESLEAAAPPPRQNLSGYLFGGVLVYNPSYAARPDNTGRALLRWGAHLDLDLWRKYLTLSYDANVFSDAEARNDVRPSEHDHIVGVLTRLGNFELGAHFETDRPADRAGQAQSYVDLHGRYYFDLRDRWPGLRQRLPRQNLSGFVTLGGFVYNETYAARPDLTGKAMLRLVGHTEIDLYRPYLTISVDLNFFTDRQVRYGLVPSELDTTLGLVLHLGDFDVALMFENDRPVDRGGLQQSYLSLVLSYRFDLARSFKRAPVRVATADRAPAGR